MGNCITKDSSKNPKQIEPTSLNEIPALGTYPRKGILKIQKAELNSLNVDVVSRTIISSKKNTETIPSEIKKPPSSSASSNIEVAIERISTLKNIDLTENQFTHPPSTPSDSTKVNTVGNSRRASKGSILTMSPNKEFSKKIQSGINTSCESTFISSTKNNDVELSADEVIRGWGWIKCGYNDVYQQNVAQIDMDAANAPRTKSMDALRAIKGTNSPNRSPFSVSPMGSRENVNISENLDVIGTLPYTAEDIIDEVKNKHNQDESYSIEEFTASTAFGVQISLDYSLERSKSLNSNLSISPSCSHPESASNIYSEENPSEFVISTSSTSNISTEDAQRDQNFSSDVIENNLSNSQYDAERILNLHQTNTVDFQPLQNIQGKTSPTFKHHITSKSRADVPDGLKREMPRFEIEIKKYMFPENYRASDYIIRKHDIGKEMYFIVTGKVEVVSGDGITVYSTIHRGSFFGD
ncbi:Cyclic nucleotide-gated olfactory channel [Nowakowskiella sp. JEL0078]|nr:Cyclic nucleotide-gated olfactory channel [Nowakowskiella sp. JEL0078]